MLIVIATLLIGAPIAIIIKALWTILLAFLLVVSLIRTVRRSTTLLVSSSRSWWRCNWRRIVLVSVFMILGISLLIALESAGRLPSLQWQSSLLNIVATIAGFWLGMILTHAFEPPTISLNNLVLAAILVTVLLVCATALVLSPISDTVPHSAMIFLWTLWLPILGVTARQFWPCLFGGRRDRLSSCDTSNTHRERPGASFDD